MLAKIKSLAAAHHAAAIELRRHFHMYPELSKKEFETQAKIRAELEALGLACRPMAGAGLTADLEGSRPGKTVAIRADIDALRTEDRCGKPYQSRRPGVCHACGHDGHTAALIGVAKILTALRGELPGRYRFIFQPSEEELPGGAKPMIAAGALDGVDRIIGAHLWQPLPVGSVGFADGRMMAEPDTVAITIQGQGGHGSMPQQTVDAMLVAAEVVMALHTIISRNINPLEPAVFSLGALQCGSVFNVVPDSAVLTGAIRSFDPATRDIILARVNEIVNGVCLAHRAAGKVECTLGYPPLVNHPDCVRTLRACAARLLGPAAVKTVEPLMGGEDFSYYLEQIPGAFILIGAGNPAKGIIYPQHHHQYDIDETALLYAMQILAGAATRLAGEQPEEESPPRAGLGL